MIDAKKIQFAIRAGAAMIFVAVPLIFYSRNPYPTISIKVALFQALVEIMAALWIVLIIVDQRFRPRLTPISLSLIFFFFALIITALSGADWTKSLWDVFSRKMGLVAMLHGGALFLILASLGQHNFNFLRQLARFAVWTGLVVSLLAVLQYFEWLTPIISFFPAPANPARPAAVFSNAPHLAGYLIFIVFLALWLFFTETKPILKTSFGLAGFLGAAAIFLSGTRGSIIGLAIGAIILALLFLLDKTTKKIGAVLLAIVIGTGLTLWLTKAAPFWQEVPGFNRLISQSTQINLGERITSWKIGLESFKERPVVGWGWGNYGVGFNKYYDYGTPSLSFSPGGYRPADRDKPYNIFIELLVSGGVLLLLGYLSVLIAFGYSILKTSGAVKPFLAALMAAYLTQNLVLFDTIATLPFFFLLLALADTGYARSREQKQPANIETATTRNRSAGVYAAAGLLLPAALAMAYFLNWNGLRAEYHQERAETYLSVFEEKEVKLALEQWDKALSVRQPYRAWMRYEYAAAMRIILERKLLGDDKDELLRRGEAAAAGLEQALRASPQSVAYTFELTDLYATLSIYEPRYLVQAEQFLEKALNLTPPNTQTLIAAAKISILRGDHALALEALQKAVSLRPELSHSQVILATLYAQAGQSDKALQEIRELLSRDIWPRFAEELIIFGDLEAGNKTYDRAAEFYVRALEAPFLNKGLPQAVRDGIVTNITVKLGFILYNLGQKENARALLKPLGKELVDFLDFLTPVDPRNQ